MISFFIFCGLGALLRYAFSKINTKSTVPLGTLCANILGAFLIGIFYRYIEDKMLYIILLTGFCGGLTTFSTLNGELLELWTNKQLFFLYFLLTYLLGFLAIFLGISI